MGSMDQGGFQNQGGAPPPPGGYPPPGGPQNPGGFPPPQSPTSSGLQDNVAALLCYLPFLLGLVVSIVFLVIEPYNTNRLIRFHAFQSIFLTVALFVAGITLLVLGLIAGFIPVLGLVISLLSTMLSLLIWLGAMILYLFMMYKSYNNERVVLPLVGPQAEKQA